jgi:ABC-type bacteriocin/lantibiotic exporter with double-glycine peptidase domain
MLLRLCGKPVRHQDVRAALPDSSEGTSLLELKTVLGAHGLDVNASDTPVSRRKNAGAPCIVWMHSGVDNRFILGHFVVVVAQTDDRATVIDGTTATVQTLKTTFLDEFGRYVIEPRAARRLPFGLASAIAVWLCALFLVGKLKFSRSGRHP